MNNLSKAKVLSGTTIRLASVASSIAITAGALLNCGGTASSSRFPPREYGCAVAIFNESPPAPSENIGPVVANCDGAVEDADCIRTLKDEVCRLGGDIAWGVETAPSIELGRKVFHGRAAHSK